MARATAAASAGGARVVTFTTTQLALYTLATIVATAWIAQQMAMTTTASSSGSSGGGVLQALLSSSSSSSSSSVRDDDATGLRQHHQPQCEWPYLRRSGHMRAEPWYIDVLTIERTLAEAREAAVASAEIAAASAAKTAAAVATADGGGGGVDEDVLYMFIRGWALRPLRDGGGDDDADAAAAAADDAENVDAATVVGPVHFTLRVEHSGNAADADGATIPSSTTRLFTCSTPNPYHRPGVATHLWMRRHARHSGYRCHITISAATLRRGAFHHIDFVWGDGHNAKTTTTPLPPTSQPEQQPGVPHRGRRGAYTRRYSYRAPASFHVPVPSAPHRVRVIGTDNLAMFALGGATDYIKIEQLLTTVFGTTYADYAHILDWGVGAGRVARHFAGVKHGASSSSSSSQSHPLSAMPLSSSLTRQESSPLQRTFTGADIDADNVAWCRTHLTPAFASFSASATAEAMKPNAARHRPYARTASFLTLPLRPAVIVSSAKGRTTTVSAASTSSTHTHATDTLPAAHFDLVYGISVFTHLRERDQFAWLAELRRVTTRGGVVLVTVHGPTAMAYAGLGEQAYTRMHRRLHAHGIWATGDNGQIDGTDAESGEHYYVNVYHTHEYIRRRWSRFFTVAAIVEGVIATHDMVVLVNDK